MRPRRTDVVRRDVEHPERQPRLHSERWVHSRYVARTLLAVTTVLISCFSGFSVWISPVSQNYYGPRTVYGDAYHGYWIQDISKLNDRFGTADDLKALSDELHKRDMYLMVDVVVNNVMAPSTDPVFSQYYFKDKVR